MNFGEAILVEYEIYVVAYYLEEQHRFEMAIYGLRKETKDRLYYLDVQKDHSLFCYLEDVKFLCKRIQLF